MKRPCRKEAKSIPNEKLYPQPTLIATIITMPRNSKQNQAPITFEPCIICPFRSYSLFVPSHQIHITINFQIRMSRYGAKHTNRQDQTRNFQDVQSWRKNKIPEIRVSHVTTSRPFNRVRQGATQQ